MSEIKITISRTGPYKIEGDPPLSDQDGRRIETGEGGTFFLCRCGGSADKPFCDGTHDSRDWDPGLAGTE